MRDPEAFANMVVMTVKSALAPLQERLAASEQMTRDLQARIHELSGLRDRMTTMEVKHAQPVAVPEVVLPEPVDLTPLLERMSANEARVAAIGDVRDRVVAIETKSLTPVVQEVVVPAPVDLGPLTAAIAELTKDVSAVRERVGVMEVKNQIPGPAGKDGENGKDGLNGKDGADGLGFDDLMAVQNDDRSFTIQAKRGDQVKELGTAKFPVMIQRGVYVHGKTYERGDVTTWDGSSWHCETETTDRPGSSKAWTLIVKRGNNGKDGGSEPPPSNPVVRLR